MQRNMGSSFGEVVQCKTEPQNAIDRYSVATMKGGLLLNIFHERYPDCVHSFCDEKVSSKHFRIFNFWIFGGIQKYL